LYVDGVQYPSKPLTPDFSAENPLYVEAYHTLYSGTGVHYLNEGNSIARSDFPYGYALFAFDITPDMAANDHTHWNLIKHGSVRLEVRFGAALTETLNCIVYAEYENIMEIDASRQVIVDFSS